MQRLNRRHLVAGGLGLGLGLGVGGAPMALRLSSVRAADGATDAPAADAPAASADKGYARGDMVLGDPAAPVEIIEYASMTCPHCAEFHNETLPAFKQRYIDSGKVRLIFREYPLDQWAVRAAMVARCVGPIRYFAMLGLLFERQREWARGSNPDEITNNLFNVARLGGVTRAQFDACLADKELQDEILQSRLTAEQTYQVSSTPTFVIDGETYAGALTIERLDQLLTPLVE